MQQIVEDELDYTSKDEIKMLKSNIRVVQELVENLQEQVQANSSNELYKQQRKAIELKKQLEQLKEKRTVEKELIAELPFKFKGQPDYNVEEIEKNINILEDLLSYKNCRYEPVQGNENSILITMEYNDQCYVKLIRNAYWQYDLKEIYPQHPNVAQLYQFLQETQDIKGFLCNLRKYFAYVTAISEMKENKL